jgi:hypothetical protein
MKKINFPVLIIAFLLVYACSDETELKKSVFIADKDYPDLPAYTEWGYNTFGAYYDRKLFIYTNEDVPVKIINSEGRTSVTFRGRLGGTQYYQSGSDMSLSFDFFSFAPKVLTDLLELNGQEVNLNTPGCGVRIKIDNEEFEADIFSGSILFKKVQKLYVDNKLAEVILSGTFQFSAVVNAEPVSITLGRFDVGVGQDNFFSF